MGKGKGKMYEEDDSNWTQVQERGNKRGYLNRSSHRTHEEATRNRGARWEQVREQGQDDQRRRQRSRRDTSPRRVQENKKEEGEIASKDEEERRELQGDIQALVDQQESSVNQGGGGSSNMEVDAELPSEEAMEAKNGEVRAINNDSLQQKFDGVI